MPVILGKLYELLDSTIARVICLTGWIIHQCFYTVWRQDTCYAAKACTQLAKDEASPGQCHGKCEQCNDEIVQHSAS
jgi:hypothetical protein